MNLRAKITSKGQITLPARLRRALGVKPGDAVEFAFERPGKRVSVRPISNVDFHRFAGAWRVGRGLSRADVDAWVRRIRGRNE